MLVAAALAGVALVGLASIVAYLVASIVFPNPKPWPSDPGTLESWGLHPEPVVTSAGSRAWYFPKPDAPHAVLVCHGRSRGKRWMLPLLARLVGTYEVLAIDFHAHGDSPGRTTSIGPREAPEVVAALEWLQGRGRHRPLVYGVSMGGAASILALSRDHAPAVRALVTDGTFDCLENVLDPIADSFYLPHWIRRIAYRVARRITGVDPRDSRPVDVVSHLQCPVLFLHGNRDPLVPPKAAERLAAAVHGGRFQYYDGEHDEPRNPAMQARVLEFFEQVTAGSGSTSGALNG